MDFEVGWLDYYCPICRLQRTLTFLVNDTFWETFQQNPMSIDLTKTKPKLFYKCIKVNLRFGGLQAFFVSLESSQRFFDIPTCLLPAIMNHFEEASHYTHQGKKLSKSKTWPVIQSCLKLWVETKKGGWANQGITIFVTLQRHSKQVWRPFYLLYSWRVWVTNHVQSWRPYRSKASIPLDHLKGVRAPDWKISKFYNQNTKQIL